MIRVSDDDPETGAIFFRRISVPFDVERPKVTHPRKGHVLGVCRPSPTQVVPSVPKVFVKCDPYIAHTV